MVSKGKGVDTGKRKGKGYDDDKTGGGRRKRNREVLQFFEDSANVDDDEDDESDFSDFDDADFMEEDFDIELKVNQEPGKTQNAPVVPKEEEMDEEEFDKMMEERYRNHPAFIRYAEDSNALDRDAFLPSKKDPVIWKVKCMIGKERQSVFCLMQKFVDVKALGTKLQIISAFSIDHVKGFIFMEADKLNDINEACKGLSTIYASRVATVPINEVTHLFSLRSNCSKVTEGMWVRVKNGKYKGDLAQIAAVNNARRKATVKLIPRIDLQMMAQKFGGGVTVKNDVTAAPRLISSSELEEFRPLINNRRDRDTGLMFEVLDGLMFKDGYLYKKVSLDSLSCWGIIPTEEELLKFKPPESNESDDLEWLTKLYGGKKKKKRTIGNDKGNEKGEGSSGSGNNFELYDLVCFDRKDFGLIVSMEQEKGDHYKILKEGPEGPVAVILEQSMLKPGPCDMKFTAFDQHKKIISVNDTVRILEGPLKDRQGIVRQIYRGIVFIYNETETENGGYFTSKALNCEKVKLAFDTALEKGGDSVAQGFEDFPSSPKSPLSPNKPWQAKENARNFHQGDGMFSIGQTLRIRVGPLKGYLCCVVAIRCSDITVKLNSKQKVLTVKSEHLSEVRSRNSISSTSEDPGTSSFKPFDLLGNESGSSAWGDAAGTSTVGGWNAGGMSSNERTSWPSFAVSGSTVPTNQSSAWDNDQSKENSSWERKAETNQNSSWGTAAADVQGIDNPDQNSDWNKNEGSWNKAAGIIGSGSNSSDGWVKACVDLADSSKKSGDSWGQSTLIVGNASSNAIGNWAKGEGTSGSQSTNWGNAATSKDQQDPWGKSKDGNEEGSWGKGKGSNTGEDSSNDASAWNQPSSKENTSTWGKAADVQGIAHVDSWVKAAGNWDAKDSSGGSKAEWKTSNPAAGNHASGWGSSGTSSVEAEIENADKLTTYGSDSGSWNKQVGKSSWGGQGGSSWNKQDDGGSWNKQDSNEDNVDRWKKPFDGGRGSDSNRGRGAGRGFQGGRGQFGRGRSFADGNNSDWSKEGRGNKWSTDGSSSWKPSSWSNSRSGGDWNDGNKEPAAHNEQSGSWGVGTKSDTGKTYTDENKGNWNSESSDAAGSWGGGKKTSWGSGSNDADGNSDSTWGKKSNWNSGSYGGDGKDSGWGQKGNDNPGDKNQNTESSWGKKTSSSPGSGDATGNSDLTWGKKSTWISGSNDLDGKDSGWGHKGNWNSGSSENTESGWGKKTSWSSGSGNADGSQESGWSKKSNWGSASGDANQDCGWGRKSNSNFGGDNANNESSVDGNGESGGNWRGSFRGRGGSDRGSFRGRGERGGFGGRGDRGGYGCRGRSDTGGYGGRGGSDRGGFGHRGGGRGYQSWNCNNDSSQDKSDNWKNEGNNSGGWKGNVSADGSSWSQGGGDKGTFKSWGSSGSGENKQSGGWSSQSKGWNQGTDSHTDVPGYERNSWKSSDSSGAGQWSSWGNSSKEVAGSSSQEGGWNIEKGAPGWGNKGSGWNKDDAADNVTTGDQTKSSWNQSGNSGGTSSGWDQSGNSGGILSGWNKGADAANGVGTEDQTKSSWNQPGADTANNVRTGDHTKSSWNQSGNSGGASTGWNQSGNSGGTSSAWNNSEEKKGDSSDAGKDATGGWSSKGGW